MGGEEESKGISTAQGQQKVLGGSVVVLALLHGHGASVHL